MFHRALFAQPRHDAENNRVQLRLFDHMQRFNAYESGVLPLVDSIRSFYNLHVARMPMPAFMHACDTFPVLMLGSAGSCMQVAHFLCCLPRHYWRFHATMPTRLRGAWIFLSALRRLRYELFSVAKPRHSRLETR